jgi:hypothetical protein
MISTWERCWFVLDDAKLYYVSEHDQDEAHKIHVRAKNECRFMNYNCLTYYV